MSEDDSWQFKRGEIPYGRVDVCNDGHVEVTAEDDHYWGWLTRAESIALARKILERAAAHPEDPPEKLTP